MDDNYGSAFLTPQFINVGEGTGLKLAEVTPVVSDYELSYGDIYLQFLDNSGASIEDKVFAWDGTKWIYDATSADASDFEIPAGQGVMVDNGVGPNDPVSFQSAGQVGDADILVTLDSNYGSAFSGNPFPVPVKLGSLTLELDPGEYTLSYGDIYLQFLDNSGASIEDKVFAWDGTKWIYDATSADASDFEIPAGQGFMVDNGVGPDEVVKLRIPAPEL